MSDVQEWESSADSNSSPAPDGFPELMQRSDVNNASREVMASVKRWFKDPTWREVHQPNGAVLRQTPTVFLISDAGGTDLRTIFIINTMVRITFGGNVWIGKVTDNFYADPTSGFTLEYQADVSFDIIGPITGNSPLVEHWGQSGSVVYRSTGTLTDNVPTMGDLEAHVTKPENTLDVGFLDGQTRDQIVASTEGNYLTNGGMRIWQRESVFNAILDEEVSADCWTTMSDSTLAGIGVANITRTTDVPTGGSDEKFTNSLKVEGTNITTPAYKSGIIQCIEKANAFDVALPGTSEVISSTVWARGTGGMNNIRAYLLNLRVEVPTLNPVTDFQSGTADVDITFEPTQWELVASQRLTLTAVWTKFTPFENVSLDITGGGSGSFAIAFVADDATFGNGDSFYITGVQIARTSEAIPYISRPLQEEQLRADRYYENTMDWEADVYPNDIVLHNGGLSAVGAGATGKLAVVNFEFSTRKFKVPTVIGHDIRGTGGSTINPWSDGVTPGGISTNYRNTRKGSMVSTALAPGTDTFVFIGLEAHANIWGSN